MVHDDDGARTHSSPSGAPSWRGSSPSWRGGDGLPRGAEDRQHRRLFESATRLLDAAAPRRAAAGGPPRGRALGRRDEACGCSRSPPATSSREPVLKVGSRPAPRSWPTRRRSRRVLDELGKEGSRLGRLGALAARSKSDTLALVRALLGAGRRGEADANRPWRAGLGGEPGRSVRGDRDAQGRGTASGERGGRPRAGRCPGPRPRKMIARGGSSTFATARSRTSSPRWPP